MWLYIIYTWPFIPTSIAIIFLVPISWQENKILVEFPSYYKCLLELDKLHILLKIQVSRSGHLQQALHLLQSSKNK